MRRTPLTTTPRRQPMIDAYRTRLRLSCRALLTIVPVGPNFYSAGPKAGLAFGGTGLCSCRVRGVDGSCAKHLTVESYMVIYAPNSYTFYH